VDISNSPLGLWLVLGFFLTGFAFTLCFWRSDRLTVTQGVDLKVPLADAVAITVQAMKAANIHGVRVEEPGRTITGHTGLSIRSLGTQCSVDFSLSDRGLVLLCHCWPRVELVLTDWGASRRALKSLIANLDRQYRLDTTPPFMPEPTLTDKTLDIGATA
jgi:hypothetical protein